MRRDFATVALCAVLFALTVRADGPSGGGGGAPGVSLQATTPGTTQTGNANISGSVVAQKLDSHSGQTLLIGSGPGDGMELGKAGDFITVNGKLYFPGGAAALSGVATLTAGTVTVSTTAVKTSSTILLTNCGIAGTALGLPTVGTIVANTSFVINSEVMGALTVQTLDTSSICWFVITN